MSQPDGGGAAIPSAPSVGTLGRAGEGLGSVPADWLRRLTERGWVREVLVLALLLAAGIAATWPRASFLTGKLPLNGDQSQDVWSLWWVARQVIHLHNPWFTSNLAAPVGVQLGFDTLSPLLGVVMAPVTLLFGPSASYNLLVIAAPGLAGYAMYRAARLWLPGLVGPLAAGAFFAVSAMLTSQDWSHMHTAVGCVFLPLALETTVRLRRDPTIGRGLLVGLVLGASILVDQESAVLVGIVVALVLIPWLVRTRTAEALRAVVAGGVLAVVLASPQLVAMYVAGGKGGPGPPPVGNYVLDAGELPSLFAPSPRLANYGLGGLASAYTSHTGVEMTATFGVVLTVLALLGLVVSWRRPATWKIGLLWLGCAVLALGPTLYISGRQHVPLPDDWRGLKVSMLMPYSWLIRLPGLASFREADRFALLGLVAAALLAGAGVEWLRRRAWPVIIVVAVLGALEAGWAGPPGQAVVPTALPALDRPIAADDSGSVVVDIPFAVRGPHRFGGTAASVYPLVLATADGHPRAYAYTAGMPERTLTGIRRHKFYLELVRAGDGDQITAADLAAARKDLRTLHVGWALVWTRQWAGPTSLSDSIRYYANIERYLAETGFKFDYSADGVMVYRPASALAPAR